MALFRVPIFTKIGRKKKPLRSVLTKRAGVAATVVTPAEQPAGPGIPAGASVEKPAMCVRFFVCDRGTPA